MQQHPTVSQKEWLAARTELLRKEKEFTRLRDRLSAERRALPWVKVEKGYVFDGPGGKQTLADLFEGRSQLIVKHFMLGPDWSEGCVGCKDDNGEVFHPYSSYGRGGEDFLGTYRLLDIGQRGATKGSTAT